MSDDNAAGQIEVEASNLGWVPKDQFRGDPEKWSDAATFLERGKHILPILRKNNETLQGKLGATQAKVAELEALYQSSQEAIQALKEYQTAETERHVKKAKADLLDQLKEAKRAGDVDTEVDIQTQIDELNQAQREAKVAKPAATEPVDKPAVDPAYTAWIAENDWFGKDRRLTALVVAEAEELRADPANRNLVGKAFFEKAAANARAILEGTPTPRQSKVEGSGRSSGGGGAVRAKSYSDLPEEAKEVCDRQAKGLVGAGKAFKTNAEWQAHYAVQYFKE